ncbi:patatin-like phospholipase family protein [Adhaeribacter swui]|uniref:Patatin-like phospholipase family protein n=1 Tax=Adhaeribacter swui TaxID=2086471 RepID=A0A7G7GDR8_9BACT|nr:patatin-like phospholipase family protein [Adhaeribacter swui]QNF35302.1 patatin-like phospholipase family protein [Adhaeribacter swui]
MRKFYPLGLLLLLLNFSSQLFAQTPAYNNRLLVVGGGGARGAWAAGFAKNLSTKYGPYRTVYGTSTGSLMAPLIVLNHFDALKTAYTSVTQRSIFNVNPFNPKTGNIKALPAIFRLIIGKNTLGESKNLRKLINQFVSAEQYSSIRNSPEKLSFTVTVVDLTTGKTEYKSSQNITDSEQMKDWMWASANQPLFMSYYPRKGKSVYVDGGVLEPVPLTEALRYALKDKTINDIDVIINQPITPLLDTVFEDRGVLKSLNRLVSVWLTEIRDNDTLISQLIALAVNNQITEQMLMALNKNNLVTPALPDSDDINIHLHYFPPNLYTPENQKELLFDKQRMLQMWQAGESGQEDPNPKFNIDSFLNPRMLNENTTLLNFGNLKQADQPITLPRTLVERFLNNLNKVLITP